MQDFPQEKYLLAIHLRHNDRHLRVCNVFLEPGLKSAASAWRQTGGARHSASGGRSFRPDAPASGRQIGSFHTETCRCPRTNHIVDRSRRRSGTIARSQSYKVQAQLQLWPRVLSFGILAKRCSRHYTRHIKPSNQNRCLCSFPSPVFPFRGFDFPLARLRTLHSDLLQLV